MVFAHRLQESLDLRERQTSEELGNGDSLSDILTRDLLAVEASADVDMITSILLLEGNRLRHGAGPSLPLAYRSAIDGVEIGPAVGSCGTAAYFGRPVHVVDIASDVLWADYRHLALLHGLRACWSTPIFGDGDAVIGTFAIYYREPRAPTFDEIEAIAAITSHVARAIMSFAGRGDERDRRRSKPALRLVTNDYRHQDSFPEFAGSAELLLDISSNFEALVRSIDVVIVALPPQDACLPQLRRARRAALRGAARAREAMTRNRALQTNADGSTPE